MATLFSKIVSGELPAYKVAENEKFLAFLDIHPMAKGHTLVIPKREEDYFFDLTDEELSAILPFARQVASAIEKEVDCKRIGLSVVGLEVPHAHLHLIPIKSVADMTFQKEPLKMSDTEFEELAGAIRTNWEATK